ncbi:alpha/beta fold hydrolase [Haloferula sargassicola]
MILAPALTSGADFFSQLDADGNGRITLNEIPEEARPFVKLVDANGDGELSHAEFGRIAASLRQMIPEEPGEVTETQNVDYVGAGHPRQTLDLYFPQPSPDEPLPLIVYLHGGGWMGGTKQEARPVADALTATGDYAVASINYRLIQDALWPAQLDDCKAAVRFLRANAKTYGIDPDRIAVMGVSAGGHLASLLGTTSGEAGTEGALGKYPGTSSKVAAVVDLFGPTNFETFFGEDTDIVGMSRTNAAIRVLGMKDEDILRNARLASPAHWVSKNDPPFLIVHGTRDDVVPFAQSAEFEEMLKAKGVDARLIAVEGGGHGFRSDELNQRIKRFLDRHLRGGTAEVSTTPIRLR